MRTKDLKIGGVYLAEIRYSRYQVIPIEATTWTAKQRKVMRSVTDLVDPPTPFDPNTGKPMAKVERVRTISEWRTDYVPGAVGSLRGSIYSGAEDKQGVPCFIRPMGRRNDDDAWTPAIVRPQNIQSTWAEAVEAAEAKAIRDQEAKVRAEEQRQLIAKIEDAMEQRGTPQYSLSYGSAGHGRVVVDAKVLAQLLGIDTGSAS